MDELVQAARGAGLLDVVQEAAKKKDGIAWLRSKVLGELQAEIKKSPSSPSPASAQRRSLPGIAVQRAAIQRAYNEACPICMEPLADQPTERWNCGHEFHVDCIAGWVRLGRHTCPYCRQETQPVPLRVRVARFVRSPRFLFLVVILAILLFIWMLRFLDQDLLQRALERAARDDFP